MSEGTGQFWEIVEKIEKTSGPGVALFFILLFAGLLFGGILLAAWAVSATINTSYWMTVLSLLLLRIVFN